MDAAAPLNQLGRHRTHTAHDLRFPDRSDIQWTPNLRLQSPVPRFESGRRLHPGERCLAHDSTTKVVVINRDEDVDRPGEEPQDAVTYCLH